MMREIIKEGRDINEAIDVACRELGVERDAAEFEIISLPKRGFLGLKHTPAKVRVYVEEPVAPVAPDKQPAPAPRREQQARPAAPLRETPPPRPAAPPAAKPAGAARPAPAAKQNTAGAEPRKPFPEKKIEPFKPAQELHFGPVTGLEGKAKTAAEYLASILVEIGVDADIMTAPTDGGIVLRLSGDALGVIIGRRGETLDAMQYLVSLVANREEGDYLRVTIDSGNYREKRERTLQQLARKISSTAVRYGRASTLEPMNPYERRIIHATVSEIEGVTSSSVGEEPNRRVVISPLNQRPQNPAGRGPRPMAGGARGGTPRPAQGGAARPFQSGGSGGGPGGAARSFQSSGSGGGQGGAAHPFQSSGSGGIRPPLRDGAPMAGGGRDNRFGGGERRRDGGDRGGFRASRPQGGVGAPANKPTSTDLDRSYAQELARQPELGKPDTPPVRPQTAPTREKALDEGKDLPLYGKIDL